VAGFESLTQQPTKPREVLTMVSGMLSEAAEVDSMVNFKEAGFKLISSCRGTWHDGRLQVSRFQSSGSRSGTRHDAKFQVIRFQSSIILVVVEPREVIVAVTMGIQASAAVMHGLQINISSGSSGTRHDSRSSRN
jgi:hypothetical protein